MRGALAVTVVALVVALVLAGCTGDPPTRSDLQGATATTGILLGVVVDQTVRPLEGATVNVTGQGLLRNATTGSDGQFRLVGLPPGTYLVRVAKENYGSHEQAAVVLAAVQDPEVVRFQLTYEAVPLPFASVYKHDGYHECGSNAARVCSNINILTWIVVCAQTSGAVCLGNVTGDRSLFFQSIEGPPTFIQAELDWDATTPLGQDLSFLIGGGTEEELRGGVSLPAYNYTTGPAPLMVRVSNHEGPDAWCRNVPDPPCSERALEDSRLGIDRVLLGQVDAGTTLKALPCEQVSPCGVGWSMQQAFTLYTAVFYGYEPPLDWRFMTDGTVPAPPA